MTSGPFGPYEGDGYADAWEAGYQQGYEDGAADAHASLPDPGPMDEDQARVQVVRDDDEATG